MGSVGIARVFESATNKSWTGDREATCSGLLGLAESESCGNG